MGVVLPGAGVRGVLLDVDDTLIGTRAAMVAAGAAAAQAIWPGADPARLAAAGHRFRADPDGHFRAYTRGACDFPTMRARRVADVAGWLGVKAGPDDASLWNTLFEQGMAQHLTVFDDVLTTLVACRDRGWPVALLTNSSRPYTERKLRITGLAAHVSELTAGVVTKDTLGVGKPAPAVFHHACALLDEDASAVLHVGDELDVDPLAALDAGLGAAWLRRPGYPHDPGELTVARGRGLAPLAGLEEVLAAATTQGSGPSVGFGSGAAAR
ncbi:HAD family hydrolase [Ornithinimicrobium sp. LYQ121]|uniref:HAD family hydrolase n=1 Tax=Ornithinimicrobium sp. LYQ121 TaxID=3378801 RepID=UPI003852502D